MFFDWRWSFIKKYNIWDKISIDIKKEFGSKPVYNKILRWWSCRFEMPKAGSNHTCLAVITIDSALKKDENCYLEVFLKEFIYIGKRRD